MLSEITLAPSVFLTTGYESEEGCNASLLGAEDILLERALIHDLWNGRLSAETIRANGLSTRGRKLLGALKTRRRLIKVGPAGQTKPETSLEWTEEAVRSHALRPVVGVLVGPGDAALFEDCAMVASINMRGDTPWWREVKRRSWDHPRKSEAYLRLLRPLLVHANSLTFIDPYFDPSSKSYSYLSEAFFLLGERSSKPHVEIHRSCYNTMQRDPVDSLALETLFAPLSKVVLDLRLSVEVFCWTDIHNRYLLTDLGGFMLGNSLSTSSNPTADDCWAAIDSDTAENLERKHSTAHRPNSLYHQFNLGA